MRKFVKPYRVLRSDESEAPMLLGRVPNNQLRGRERVFDEVAMKVFSIPYLLIDKVVRPLGMKRGLAMDLRSGVPARLKLRVLKKRPAGYSLLGSNKRLGGAVRRGVVARDLLPVIVKSKGKGFGVFTKYKAE